MVIELAPHILVAARLGEIEYLFRLFELRASIPVSYICAVTDNLIIMKKAKDSRISKLSTDVVEYMFVEWLCRRGVYSAFKSNYDSTKEANMSFRDALRRHILNVALSSHLCISDLVSSSFVFDGTPEGRDFWSGVSSDWHHFCIDFRNTF